MPHTSSPKRTYLFLFLLFYGIFKGVGQCAGEDGQSIICEKDTDPNYQVFDLFGQLGGSPQVGGTWLTEDPTNVDALDPATGILNLWKVNTYGEHVFTYTNPDCGQTATVTLRLGGYPGEDNIDGSANVCSDNGAVNLFNFIGSSEEDKIQDFNGIWEEIPFNHTGFIYDDFYFDAYSAGAGIYEFSYTVENVDGCPPRSVRLLLEVHKNPSIGTSEPIVVCTIDDLSALTNVDLHDYLTDEDMNGFWSETDTGQLSGQGDSFIDIQAINQNLGPGSYDFTYGIYDAHPSCQSNETTINLSILPALVGNLTGGDYCGGEAVSVILAYDGNLLDNAEYAITYEISTMAQTITGMATVLFTDGSATIPLDVSGVPNNQTAAVSIVSLEDSGVCSNIDVTPAQISLASPQISAGILCLNTNNIISLSNITDSSGSFSNTTETIKIALTDPSGRTTMIGDTFVNFTEGSGSFVLEGSNMPEAGSYRLSVTVPNVFIECPIETTFEVLPDPPNPILELLVDNRCDATEIEVSVDAPTLSNGEYTITYGVVEENTATILLENTINFTGGSATYAIDIATLEEGEYTVVLRSGQTDETTPCRTQFVFELQDGFSIGGMPEMPQAPENQSFCSVLYPSGPTLTDIEVYTEGTPIFYDDEVGGEPLELATLLVDGEDYFVETENPENNCTSGARTRIQVLLYSPEMLSTTDENPEFCAIDGPTLAQLFVFAPNGGNVVWYAQETGGDPLPIDLPLEDNTVYYAHEEVDDGCSDPQRLAITPVLITISSPELGAASFSGCSLDAHTIANLVELQTDNGQYIRWYDMENGGEPLLEETVLIDGQEYYAEHYDPMTNCRNTTRAAVQVDLYQCEPEQYGFFVANAFSPNGDGRNDTFFIPNIEAIFPEFSYEVYNRYGALIFRGDATNPAWDGRHNNKPVASGIYFFILNYNREGYQTQQSTITLNR